MISCPLIFKPAHDNVHTLTMRGTALVSGQDWARDKNQSIHWNICKCSDSQCWPANCQVGDRNKTRSESCTPGTVWDSGAGHAQHYWRETALKASACFYWRLNAKLSNGLYK